LYRLLGVDITSCLSNNSPKGIFWGYFAAGNTASQIFLQEVFSPPFLIYLGFAGKVESQIASIFQF
jgi:hypothetical protein